MAAQKKNIEEQKPVVPPAEKKPKPLEKKGCETVPGKNSKGGTNQPPCPDGYPDRQPATPPDEDPDQRAH